MLPKLLLTRDIADLLHVSDRCVEGWRQRGTGPAYIKLAGGRVRYRREDVEAWIKTNRRSKSAD